MDDPHLVRELAVPPVENPVTRLVPRPVTGCDCLDERAFARRDARTSLERPARLDRGVMAERQGLRDFLPGVAHPGAVIEWAAGKGDAPPGHCAVRIEFESRAETGDGFFMVERVHPVQAAVKPGLRLLRSCRDFLFPGTRDKFVGPDIVRQPGSPTEFGHVLVLAVDAIRGMDVSAFRSANRHPDCSRITTSAGRPPRFSASTDRHCVRSNFA